MSISFLKPIYLLLLIPLMLFLWFGGKKNKYTERKGSVLSLRAFVIIPLIIALCQPLFVQRFKGQSIIYLSDSSQSMQYTEGFEDWIRESQSFKGKNDQWAVLAMGLDTQLMNSFESNNPVNFANVQVKRDFTNIEGAMKTAHGLLPRDSNNRIVIISDGYENVGDSLSYAKILKANNIPVDVYPLKIGIDTEVAISQVSLPSVTFAGQRISVEIELESTVNTSGVLSLFMNEQLIYNGEVNISSGRQKTVFPVEIKGSGFQRVTATIQPKADTIGQNNKAQGLTFVEAAPKVLLVEGSRGVGQPLIDVFAYNGVDVDPITVNHFPNSLEGLLNYKTIIFVDVPAYFLSDIQMKNIKNFVDVIGGGFIATGGRNSFGVGLYQDTPLEEILPITMEVENEEEMPGVDLVLVIDKSGSMSGEKLNMAKNAGVSALDILTEKDRLGLITFDHGYTVDFQLTPTSEKDRLKNIIQGIPLGGGTSIHPALEKAVELFDSSSKNKHIILLSDGVEGPQNYEPLLEKMRDSSITLSSIALGDDADIRLMEYLAVNGGGRFYDVRNVQDLPGVFAKETILAGGNYIIEEDFVPSVVRSSFIPFSSGLPEFNGYIGSTLKPQGEGIIFTHREHPLYARMQYGLGRTVAFTTDTFGMWSKNFMQGADFPSFWMDTLSWVSGRGNYGDISAAITLKDAGAQIDILVGEPLDEDESIQLSIIDEEGNRENIVLSAASSNNYRATTPALSQGIYFINATRKQGEQIRALSMNGFVVPYSKEFAIENLKSSSNMLEELAKATGGRILTRPSEVFNANYNPVRRSVDISWMFILLSLLIWPLDIAFRRFAPTVRLPKINKKENAPEEQIEAGEDTMSRLLKAKKGRHKNN